MKVEQIMSRPALTCSPRDSAHRAAQVMWDADIGSVVVTEGQRIAGMITDRDICMAASMRGAPLHQILVGEVMTCAVTVVRLDDRVGMAEALMRTRKVRRLPVVDSNDNLVGLLSLNDVARAAQEQRGLRAPDVAGDEVISTLGAICEPRRTIEPLRLSIAVGGHETVVLVEDEPALLTVTTRLLQRLGYQVLAFDTAAGALSALPVAGFDARLLISDVIMPGLDGRQLSDQLLSRMPNLKVLFISGYTSDVLSPHGVLDEGRRLLEKPFSELQLSVAVREALDGSG